MENKVYIIAEMSANHCGDKELAKKIIESTFSYLNDENIDLDSLFTNLSYTTGLDCSQNKELKYFEF